MKVLLIGGTSAGKVMDIPQGKPNIEINCLSKPLLGGAYYKQEMFSYHEILTREVYLVTPLAPEFAIAYPSEISLEAALNLWIQGYQESLSKRG